VKFVGAVLVLAGILGLGWGVMHGGFRFTRQDSVVPTGDAAGSVVKTHSLPLAPIGGAFCIIAGVIVLVAGAKREPGGTAS
jgi:hypothetical protein